MKTHEKQLAELQSLKLDCYGKDFLLTWEKTDDELRAVLLLAGLFSALHQERRSFRVFDTGLAISIFRDNSTRTRFSFASAANALGLALADLDEGKSQIAHGETVRETANMISFLAEVIGIRDDMYLGEGNRYMREVASAVQEGFEQGLLHQRPSVINLQCDLPAFCRRAPSRAISSGPLELHEGTEESVSESLRGDRPQRSAMERLDLPDALDANRLRLQSSL